MFRCLYSVIGGLTYRRISQFVLVAIATLGMYLNAYSAVASPVQNATDIISISVNSITSSSFTILADSNLNVNEKGD